MRRALSLAARGEGRVHPNPMVGAVVVSGDRIVGEGWHDRFGGPHAEVNALAAAGSRARGAALFVTLEPCAHQGKTPPCVDAIREAGVARVVVASMDPNPVVAGRGISELRAAGIEAEIGSEGPAARRLNAGYHMYHAAGRPWVSVKLAVTLDGRIAGAGGESRWITSMASRREVHRLRARVDAVVVGRRTVERDDPSLTVRHVSGRNPARVVLDSRGALPAARRVFTDGAARTVRVTLPGMRADGGEQWVIPPGADGRPDLAAFLGRAADEGWRDLLVEGGGELTTALLRLDLVDRLYLFQSPRVLGAAGSSGWAGELGATGLDEARRFRFNRTKRFGPDLLCVLEAGDREEILASCSPASSRPSAA